MVIAIKKFQESFPDNEVNILDVASDDPSIRLRGIYLDSPNSDDMILFLRQSCQSDCLKPVSQKTSN
ncbi:hypothetical protein [Planctobacterium marinum]|uniref:hypothetical protein n=1 Tax=Planctobacterium marinum TaxID=1631968 RepID=UPI001E5DC469|nr:hypothetical protein [Planctobacterium marinum]MCC2605979.1 hypothetical protein [Planctobacterium marinum]